jgi:PKHD-type hydroxylase
MSYYRFAPAYSFDKGEYPFVSWDNGFTTEEIDQIVNIGENLPQAVATVGDDKNDPSVRRSNTAWMGQDDCPWLYDRLAWIVQQLNGQFYGYDLWGFHEDMQYTTYTSADQGFYDYHQDSMGFTAKNGVDQRLPRKFSISLQLTDPSEYEGGDLLIRSGSKPTYAPKQKGQVVAFPSFMLHKVTPVTAGIRRSLVVWVTGPAFK